MAMQTRTALVIALLAQTSMPIVDVAAQSGFASAQLLRQHWREVFGMTPSQWRVGQSTKPESQTAITVRLPLKGSYNMDWAFQYLEKRALEGIEEVDGHHYQRRVSFAGQPPVWVEVWGGRDGLHARLPLWQRPVYQWLERVVRLFDLRADSGVIDSALAACSPLLSQSVKQAPGLRVMGAWDGFETAVRGVLGQQVSVARGTELANRMIQTYGQGDFPSPGQLQSKEIAELGMPRNRGRAIATMAAWVAKDGLELTEGAVAAEFVGRIGQIKGIGPWTQNYLRLRVVKDADAFPHNDWVVLKQLQVTPAVARDIAEQWRPWRAYALMHLWRLAGLARQARG